MEINWLETWQRRVLCLPGSKEAQNLEVDLG